GNVNPFTAVNGGSSLVTTVTFGGCVAQYSTSTGNNNIQGQEVSRTGNTGPYAWLKANGLNLSSFGVYVRDSAGGRILSFEIDTGSTGAQLVVNEFNSLTSYNSTPYGGVQFTFSQP